MSAKRYYWLKLKNTYFSQLDQKKMRKQKNGKDMQIIYLRMMLLSIDKGGYIYYQGFIYILKQREAGKQCLPTAWQMKYLRHMIFQ